MSGRFDVISSGLWLELARLLMKPRLSSIVLRTRRLAQSPNDDLALQGVRADAVSTRLNVASNRPNDEQSGRSARVDHDKTDKGDLAVLRTNLLQIGAAVSVPATIVECVAVDKMHFPRVTRLIGRVHD